MAVGHGVLVGTAGTVESLLGLMAGGVLVAMAACGADGGRVGAGDVGVGRSMTAVDDGCGATDGDEARLFSEKANERLPMINPIEIRAKMIPPAISLKLRTFLILNYSLFQLQQWGEVR